jgi:hypothetical protein
VAGAKRWGKEAIKALFNGIGSYGISWFQQRSDAPYDLEHGPKKRSRQAVYKKAQREFGKGGLTRGAYTLEELQNNTGYNREQILRARDACKQKWKRLGPRGDHLITEEQVEEILEWLKHDYWSKVHRLYCCRRCTTDSAPHYGAGLCERCYFRYRRDLERRGLPTSTRALKAKIRSLDIGKSGEHGTFLDKVVRDLERGVSLDDASLDWLEMIW